MEDRLCLRPPSGLSEGSPPTPLSGDVNNPDLFVTMTHTKGALGS